MKKYNEKEIIELLSNNEEYEETEKKGCAKMELMRNNKTITIVDDIEMLDYLEKLGNACIDTIEKQYPHIKLKNYFTFKLAELDNNIAGSYYRIKTDLGKYLNRYVLIDFCYLMLNDEDTIKETIYHELGHIIHEKYFNEIDFKLSRNGDTLYSRRNHMEDFAEGVMQLFCHSSDLYYCKERREQMDLILKGEYRL